MLAHQRPASCDLSELLINYPTGVPGFYVYALADICIERRGSACLWSIHHAPKGTPYEAHNMTHQHRSGQLIFEHQYGMNQDLTRRLRHTLPGLVGPLFRSRSSHGRKPEAMPQSRLSRFLPFLFIVLWVISLWWGERVVFRRSVETCAWDRWESWVSPLLNAHFIVQTPH